MNEFIPEGDVWLVFDCGNGHGTKHYVWWFKSREKARAFIKHHNKQKFAYEVSQPIKYKRDK